MARSVFGNLLTGLAFLGGGYAAFLLNRRFKDFIIKFLASPPWRPPARGGDGSIQAALFVTFPIFAIVSTLFSAILAGLAVQTLFAAVSRARR